MPKIDIREIDLTTPGSVIESTDVVFIPGFVDASQTSLINSKGEYIGLEVDTPHLFTDIEEFETLCGENAPIFMEDQLYDDALVTDASGNDCAFLEGAIPANCGRVMIKKGTPDPSYVMAKELLASGLGVLYQRVNDASSNEQSIAYELVDEEIQNTLLSRDSSIPSPDDSEYFYKKNNSYYSYKSPVNYPDFNSFFNKSIGTGTIYKITTIDSYQDVLNYYNGQEGVTYHVYDGEIITDADPRVKEDNTIVTFARHVLIQNADGSFKQLNDDPNGELAELPASNDEINAVYAIYNLMADQPNDWETAYDSYFEAQYNSEHVVDSYKKITKVDSYYKQYESQNIYRQVEKVVSAFSVNCMYKKLFDIFSVGSTNIDSNVSGLIDKGNFSVKYLTSGGYPVFEHSTLANNMLTMAETRGDCVALIDHTDFPNREMNPYKEGSLYKSVMDLSLTTLEKGEFGAMFTPWATYSRITTDSNNDQATFRAPGSYAYLLALADSIKTNANWLAIAGATRGGVKNLFEMNTVIPNGVADAMQPRDAISVNAITNIKPYGYTIWGNRTLKNNAEQGNLVATSFLNIRNLVSDVKKTCYRVARKLTFEQDTDVLWINFKSEIAKLLDRMKSGYGISGYKIIRDASHERAKDKATLCAKVILYPTYAVEDFYITIVLKDDEVSVD